MTDKQREDTSKLNRPPEDSEARGTKATDRPDIAPARPPMDRPRAPDEPAKPGPGRRPSGSKVEYNPSAAPATPANKGGRGLAIVALVIALIAVIGSGYLWYLLSDIREVQSEQSAQLAQQSQQVAQQSQQVNQQLEQISQQSEQLAQLDERLTQTLAGLDVQDIAALKELKTVVDSQQAEIQSLRDEFSGHAQEQQTALTQATDRIEDLQTGQQDMRNSLESVRNIALHGGDINALALSEVEYLLRMADHKLRLEQDVESALEALTVAETRLAAIDEDPFDPVQQRIRDDIATLRGLELPDISGLTQRIGELSQQIDALPIDRDIRMAERRVRPEDADEAAPEPRAPWWERAANTVWSQLRDVIVVRHERADRPPLVAAEEEYFLRQNLRLELDAMRLALLRDDIASYQQSNQTARNWVESYFDSDDEQVGQFLNELNELQAVQFDPDIPDVSATLQAFHDAMEHRQPIRPIAPTADDTARTRI